MDKAEHENDSMLPITDRLITIGAAQQQLGVSRSKLYRMLDENELPRPIKIGRRAYFSEIELQAWIAEKLAARPGQVNAADEKRFAQDMLAGGVSK